MKARIASRQRGYWEACFGKRPPEELYDLKVDRDCPDNLAGRGQSLTLKADIRRQLFEELRTQADPRMFGQGHVFDEYPDAEEQTRHFYDRYGLSRLVGALHQILRECR